MTLASDALAIARAGIRAVDPAQAVRRSVATTRRGFRIGVRPIPVGPGGRIHLVAIGKAAGPMADAASRCLGRDVEGIAIAPHGYPAPRDSARAVWGDHPVPGPRSFRAGRELLRFVAGTSSGDAVLFLISGGGSATVEAPSPGVAADDLRRTTELLLSSGAPIGAMNAIRRHLSQVKGGRLAVATTAATFGTVALSDVVGDPPPDVASGPTVGDPSRFRDAVAAWDRYPAMRRAPGSIRRYLRDGARGLRPETPKPGDTRFRGRPFVFGGTNRVALAGAAAEARRRGYATHVGSSRVVGETRPVAEAFARRLMRRAGTAPRSAWLTGGETTVTLGPDPGKGGRNQEFVLAAAPILAGRPILILSAGTDGVDGPTDAAGGWVDGATAEDARRVGVDLRTALERHAGYDALRRLGRLWRPGPTGTNVMDLHLGLIGTGPGGVRGTAGSSRPDAAPSSRRRRS